MRKRAPFVSYRKTEVEKPRYIPNHRAWGKRVYAICFDLDGEIMERLYHTKSWRNGYRDVANVLSRYGFRSQQESVYFGDESVDSVRCVIAIQDVVRSCPWFRAAAHDVRMLRIEDENDLMPAMEAVPIPDPEPREAAE